MAIKIGGETVIDDSEVFTGAYSDGMVPRLSNISAIYKNNTYTTLTHTPNSFRYRSVRLSSSTILTCNAGASDYMYAFFVDSSYTVTQSSAFQFSGSSVSSNSICIKRLTDTSALLVYGLDVSPYTIKARVITLSGTTLSAGSEYTIKTPPTATVKRLTLAKVDSAENPTKFIVGYSYINASSYSECCVNSLTVSGTVVTVGTEVIVDTLTSLNTTYNSSHDIHLPDHDNDTLPRYPFCITRPNVLTGTWSRDTNGKVTITATGVRAFLNLGTSVSVSTYLAFTSGSSPPSNGHHLVTLPTADTLEAFTTNTTSDSGNVDIYCSNYFHVAMSLSAGAIGTVLAPVMFTPGGANANPSVDYLHTTIVSNNYAVSTVSPDPDSPIMLVLYAYVRGMYKAYTTTSTTYMASLSEIGCTGNSTYVATKPVASIVGSRPIDIFSFDKKTKICLGMHNSSSAVANLCAFTAGSSSISYTDFTTFKEYYTYAVNDMLSNGEPFENGLVELSSVQSAPIKNFVSYPINKRNTAGRSAIFPLDKSDKFLYFYPVSGTVAGVAVLQMDL